MPSRLLVFGAGGQVGRHLLEAAARMGRGAIGRAHAEVDICDSEAVARAIAEAEPTSIVNAAAYTAVDRAESDTDKAFKVNRDGAGIVAAAATKAGIPLIHLSTDYVFDGRARTPYKETDPVGPQGVYARSKEAGERGVIEASGKHLILRTAWVYESRGRNFLLTILRLAKEKDELRIVGDQRGSPTAAREIAAATARLLESGLPEPGTFHVTAGGETTWHGFATEILRLTGKARVRVTGITTGEYPTPARRPRYSVLSNERIRSAYGIALPDWRETLARVCREVESPA